MSKTLEEYGSQKSTSITTAKRLVSECGRVCEFLILMVGELPVNKVIQHHARVRYGKLLATFQSEGETLVGNLYLPATYKAGERLPAIIVTGAWTTLTSSPA